MNNINIEVSANDDYVINKMNIDDKLEKNNNKIINKEDFKK